MSQQVNNSLWALSRRSKVEVNSLKNEHKTDIVIIGGGYTGCSAALRLAEGGADVTLIEAEYSGFGGSGRNVGLTNAGLWLDPEDIEKAIGKEYGSRLNDFLSKAPDLVHGLIDEHGIECDALRNGTLHLAHSGAGLKALEKKAWQINSRGGSVMMLDKSATYALTKAENYIGAIHDMRGGTIQPLDYCYGLMLAAKKAGATIFNGTPAQSIRHGRKKWHIKTPDGMLVADRVLLATNAYLKDVSPLVRSSFTPMYYSQLATDPLSEEQLRHFLPGKNGTWDTRLVMRSFRTDAAGRLIIGTIGNIYTDNASLLCSWANKVMRDTFPGVGDVKWSYKWAGRMACSSNYVPNLHDLGRGLYSISGFSGRGISPGTAFGRVMADFMLGRIVSAELPLPLKTVEPVKLNMVRQLYFETGSQLSHLYDHLN